MCIYKTFCTARIEARIAKAVMYMNIYCIVYFYWFKYMHVYSFIYIQLSARHESRRSFEAAPLSSFSKQITNRGEICSFEAAPLSFFSPSQNAARDIVHINI